MHLSLNLNETLQRKLDEEIARTGLTATSIVKLALASFLENCEGET